MSLRSCYDIHSLGHKLVLDILKYPCIVEEKIDGSQFSFGKFDGKLECRYKRGFYYPRRSSKDVQKGCRLCK